MKGGELLKRVLIKAGQYDEATMASMIEALNATDVEINDTQANLTANMLMTRSEAEKTLSSDIEARVIADQRPKLRSEVYDKFDKMMDVYKAGLSEEEIKDFDAFGDKDTTKKVEYLLDRSLQAKGSAKDAIRFKQELDKVLGKIETDYVPKTKYDEVEKSVGSWKDKYANNSLLSEATLNDNIASEVKGQRWFKNQFIADTTGLLTKNKWAIDHETNKILNEKGEVIIKEGTSDDMTISDLVSTVATTYKDYTKVSDGGQGKGNVIVGAGDDKDGKVGVFQADMSRIAAEQGMLES